MHPQYQHKALCVVGKVGLGLGVGAGVQVVLHRVALPAGGGFCVDLTCRAEALQEGSSTHTSTHNADAAAQQFLRIVGCHPALCGGPTWVLFRRGSPRLALLLACGGGNQVS